MSYAIDAAGVELIASFEGYVDGVYNDSRGFATCGYGHLLHTSGATRADHATYDGKGRDFFLRLLHQDIQRVAIGPMNASLKVPMNQHRVNAVASACFNCGPGFVEGTVGRLINARKWQAAADAFLLWSHPSVLRARRVQEAHLFLTAPAAAKNNVALPWLTAPERKLCLEYDRLKKANRNIARRRELRGLMHQQATDIAVAARHGGWEINGRRQRYHSLIARSS